jgi:hypothetical protein
VYSQSAPLPSTGGARAGDQRQVGRPGAEEFLGVLARHRDAHRLADLLGGEHQVVLDLLLGQADVLEAVVADVAGAVAVQAVVHEQLGAVLQGGRIGGAVRRAIELQGHAGQGGERREEQRDDHRA